MGFKKTLMGAVVGLVLLGAAVVPAFAASLILNGSFENGTDPGTFTTVHPGDTNIDNWTVVSGSVDYIGTYWQASNGSRSLDMSGNEAGAISQSFSTVAGHMYTVTFDMAGNPDGGPTIKTMNVDAGASPSAYTFDVAGHTKTSMGWTQKTFTFTATGSATTLTFTSTTAGFFGPALDNVVVTQQPPTSKKQCKDGGWKTFTDPTFKNQGQCVAFVEDHQHHNDKDDNHDHDNDHDDQD